MKRVPVRLDDETPKQLDIVAPAMKRAEFIRRAIAGALRRSEFDRIRDSYLRQPDNLVVDDEWPDPEEWRQAASGG